MTCWAVRCIRASLAVRAVPKAATAAEPDWLRKADYGKAPDYLATVKREIEDEHEYIQSLLDQQQVRISCM